jgi:dihydrofolate reductase
VRTFDLVVAADQKLGIGKGGTLPWKLPKDMAYFRRVTSEVRDTQKQNAVIMGRKTWESIPPKFRPLPQRVNIIVSRQAQLELPAGVLHARDLEDALKSADTDNIETVFVIGGGEIFRTALQHPACKLLYLTDIHADFDCDTFLPDYQQDFVPLPGAQSAIERDNGIEYEFKVFIRHSLLHCAESAGIRSEGQPRTRC